MSKKLFLLSALALPIAGMAHAVSLSPSDDADALAGATLAADSGISIVAGSASLIGDATQQGTYSDFNLSAPGSPTLSMNDGAALTTATLDFSTTENTTNNGFGTNSSTGAYQPLVDLADANGLSTSQSGANVLSFDFTLDDAEAEGISTTFSFGTEEFPTQSVTDIVGVFVNGVNYAFFPNGDLISNQGGDPNSFFNDGYPIELNGFTDIFTLEAPTVEGTNTIAFAVSNTADQIFDSALFASDLMAIGEVSSGGGGIITHPSPIPLPAGGLLLLSGLGFLAVRRKR